MRTTAPQASTYLVEFNWNQDQLTLISDALIDYENKLHRASDQAAIASDYERYIRLVEKRDQLESVARKLISYADELGHR